MDVRGVFSRNVFSKCSIAVTREWAIRYDLSSSVIPLDERYLRSETFIYHGIELLAFLASAISLVHL